MHGIGAEPGVDHIRPDDFGGHAGVDILVGQAAGGVFGQKQLADLALGIGQSRRYRMPAIENHRPIGAAVAVAPGRPGGRFSPFFEGFTAAAAERWFSVSIAHGPACVTGSGLWQFGAFDPVFGGFRWLTLPWPFAHKRADRERAIGSW